jgi:hypothetical protein
MKTCKAAPIAFGKWMDAVGLNENQGQSLAFLSKAELLGIGKLCVCSSKACQALTMASGSAKRVTPPSSARLEDGTVRIFPAHS